MKYDAEILIAGAGPAGCATAIRLVDAGCDVLVIERDTLTPGPDLTSGEVLSPMAQRELRDVGLRIAGDWVFDQVDKVRNVYPDLSWTLHSVPSGLEYRHIDRGGLNAALRQRLLQAGGRIECEQTVTEVDMRDDGVVLRTRHGREFRANMLIDAAGGMARRSPRSSSSSRSRSSGRSALRSSTNRSRVRRLIRGIGTFTATMAR